MAKVLIIEDDKDLCALISQVLERSRYSIEMAHLGHDGLDFLKHYTYDIIILDMNLPDMSGIEVLKKFRANNGQTPVLILTSRANINDKESGFSSGADDYLTKPFDLKELVFRISALLRRAPEARPTVLKSGKLTLDLASRKAFKNNTELKLLPTEFALLEFFMRFPNHVFSVDDILARVWKSDSEASAVGVRTYITRLRKKIEEDGDPPMISNVYGQGYRFEPLE